MILGTASSRGRPLIRELQLQEITDMMLAASVGVNIVAS
jgi:hypothetical protein